MYSNSPFKNKQAAKADINNPSSNPAGPGTPAKKTGTATTETRLDRLTAAYEAGNVETKKKLQPAIMREHGGAEYIEEKQGGIGQTSEGKKVTIAESANMRGTSKEEVTKALQVQAANIMRSTKKKN